MATDSTAVGAIRNRGPLEGVRPAFDLIARQRVL